MSNDIGFRVSLETGEAESSAHNLARAFESLGQAMQKATIAGDSDSAEKYGELMLRYRKQMIAEAKVGGGKEEESLPAMRTVQGVTRFINRGTNYISAAGSGNAAGAALNAVGDSAGLLENLKGVPLMAGAVVGGLVALGAGANKLSEQFEKVMQPSMGLAATLGMLTNDAKKNSIAFSEALNRSSDQAIKYGYSMEEGIQLATDLGKRGIKKDEVFAAEGKIFQYQRSTNVDRESLVEAESLSKRFGLRGDSLGYAYGGTLASGMQSGQFQEYLNATLRIFQEGISRGVVKGFGEITRTQNMLATIGTAWKGEYGAQRYQQMNDAVIGAGQLNTDYDVITYRAMQNVIKNAQGKKNEYDKHGNLIKDNEQYQGIQDDNYIAVQKKLEKGISPELLDETMKLLSSVSTNDTSLITQVQGLFHLNATSASQLTAKWKSGDLKGATASAKDPEGSIKSTEASMLSELQTIRKDLANAGQNVLPAKEFFIRNISAIANHLAGSKMQGEYKKDIDTSLGGIFSGRGEGKTRDSAEKYLSQAIISSNPIVVESSQKISELLSGLSPLEKEFLDQRNILDLALSGLNDKNVASRAKSIESALSSDKYAEEYKTYKEETRQKVNRISSFPGRDSYGVDKLLASIKPEAQGEDENAQSVIALLSNLKGDKEEISRRILPAYFKIGDARSSSSDGGSTITAKEWEGIIKALKESVGEFSQSVRSGILVRVQRD